MLSTSAILADAQALVKAVQQARGGTPTVLASFPPAAHDLLAGQGAPTDPARTIVDGARNGTLTETSLADLLTEAAHAQMVASYTGDTRRRIAPLFVAAFFEALQDGTADRCSHWRRVNTDGGQTYVQSSMRASSPKPSSLSVRITSLDGMPI